MPKRFNLYENSFLIKFEAVIRFSHKIKLVFFTLGTMFLFSFLLLTGCGKGYPDFVIPNDTMVLILKDMHIAHAGVDLTQSNPDTRTKLYRDYNKVVLDYYLVSTDRFLQSMEFFERRPEELDSIYSQVIEQINLELTPLQSKSLPINKVPIAE